MNFKFGLYLLPLATLISNPPSGHDPAHDIQIVQGKLNSHLSVCASAGAITLGSATEGEEFEPGECFSSDKQLFSNGQAQLQFNYELETDYYFPSLENYGAKHKQFNNGCASGKSTSKGDQKNAFAASSNDFIVSQKVTYSLNSSATGGCYPSEPSCIARSASSMFSEQKSDVAFLMPTVATVAKIEIFFKDDSTDVLNASATAGVSIIKNATEEIVFSKEFDQSTGTSLSYTIYVPLEGGSLYTFKAWSKANRGFEVVSGCGTQQDAIEANSHFFCELCAVTPDATTSSGH